MKIINVILFFGLLIISGNAQDTKPELYSQTGHITEVNSVAFSPDGKILASGSIRDTKLWDVSSGQEIRTFNRQAYGGVLSVIFSPDGNFLAIGTGGDDESLVLWDVKTGKKIKSFNIKGGCRTVEFSPNGKFLASNSLMDVLILNIASDETYYLKPDRNRPDTIYSISFSPEGNFLAVAGDSTHIKLWDLESRKEIKTFLSDGYNVSTIAFSPDGKMLANDGGSDSVQLWEVNTGKQLASFKGHAGWIKSIKFSPDGKFLASASRDKTIKIWNINSRTEYKTLTCQDKNGCSEMLSVSFSPNGELIASGNYDHMVRLWNVQSGQQVKALRGQTNYSNSALLSPDGKLLASASLDHSIKLWDMELGQMNILGEHEDSVTAIAFSPDGKILVSNDFKQIKFWDLRSKTEIKNLLINRHTFIKLNVQHFDSVTISPDGNLLAIAVFLPSNPAAYQIIIWDKNLQQIIKTLKLSRNELPDPPFGVVRRMDFSPDGKVLFARNIVNYKFLDVSSEQEIKYDKFPDWVNNIDIYNSNQTRIELNNQLDHIDLVNADTRKVLITLTSLDKNNWFVTTPDGFFDGTPNAWKSLIWRFNNNTFDYASVETYFNDFFYPNLLQDVLAGKSPQAKAGSELEKIDRRKPLVEIVSVGGQSKDQIDAQTINQTRTAKVLVEVSDNVSEKKQANHAAASGAQDLRLMRNGTLVKVWHDDVFKLGKADGCEQINKPDETRRVRCAVDVPIVAGENNFSAYAFNLQNVKSEDDAISVKGAESLKRDGTLYVLAIGVNKYQNADYNLNYAVPDVVDIGNAIKNQQTKLSQDANLKQYSRTEIITLKDETATKDNILLALDRFNKDEERSNLPDNLCAKLNEKVCDELKSELQKIKSVQPEDALLIYYAGHGTSREQRFYLLPHNFTDAKELEKQAVSDLELNDTLEKVDAGKLLMVIDACQSGQALGEKSEGRAPMNSKGLAQLAYDKGMLILTAAQSYQAALEAPRIGEKKIEHGLLTYALLEAFSNKEADKDSNKQIWEREWFDFAVSQVPLLQREAMKQRDIDLKNKTADVQDRSEIYYLNGDKNTDAENRNVQTPRVFYRREAELKPFILANP